MFCWLAFGRFCWRVELFDGNDVFEEHAGTEERTEVFEMFIAREPLLAALWGMNLRVVPFQDVVGVGLAALA